MKRGYSKTRILCPGRRRLGILKDLENQTSANLQTIWLNIKSSRKLMLDANVSLDPIWAGNRDIFFDRVYLLIGINLLNGSWYSCKPLSKHFRLIHHANPSTWKELSSSEHKITAFVLLLHGSTKSQRDRETEDNSKFWRFSGVADAKMYPGTFREHWAEYIVPEEGVCSFSHHLILLCLQLLGPQNFPLIKLWDLSCQYLWTIAQDLCQISAKTSDSIVKYFNPICHK